MHVRQGLTSMAACPCILACSCISPSSEPTQRSTVNRWEHCRYAVTGACLSSVCQLVLGHCSSPLLLAYCQDCHVSAGPYRGSPSHATCCLLQECGYSTTRTTCRRTGTCPSQSALAGGIQQGSRGVQPALLEGEHLQAYQQSASSLAVWPTAVAWQGALL